MKVKARDCGIWGLRCGEIYEVLEKRTSKLNESYGEQYKINNSFGLPDWINHSHFTVIEEQEPEITVGSEWVSGGFKGEVATVKYVGEHKVFIKWRDGSEGERFIDTFHDSFKPKPKTVTMYFYKLGTQLCACEVKPAATPVLFTREIEL